MEIIIISIIIVILILLLYNFPQLPLLENTIGSLIAGAIMLFIISKPKKAVLGGDNTEIVKYDWNNNAELIKFGGFDLKSTLNNLFKTNKLPDELKDVVITYNVEPIENKLVSSKLYNQYRTMLYSIIIAALESVMRISTNLAVTGVSATTVAMGSGAPIDILVKLTTLSLDAGTFMITIADTFSGGILDQLKTLNFNNGIDGITEQMEKLIDVAPKDTLAATCNLIKGFKNKILSIFARVLGALIPDDMNITTMILTEILILTSEIGTKVFYGVVKEIYNMLIPGFLKEIFENSEKMVNNIEKIVELTKKFIGDGSSTTRVILQNLAVKGAIAGAVLSTMFIFPPAILLAPAFIITSSTANDVYSATQIYPEQIKNILDKFTKTIIYDGKNSIQLVVELIRTVIPISLGMIYIISECAVQPSTLKDNLTTESESMAFLQNVIPKPLYKLLLKYSEKSKVIKNMKFDDQMSL